MTSENQEKVGRKALQDSISFRLNVLTSILNRHSERYLKNQYGIAMPDWRAIAILSNGEKVSVRELAVNSKMDKAMVSRVVSRLVSSGYVLSEPDPSDGRLLILSITPSGKNLYQQIKPVFADRDERLMSVLKERGSEFQDSLDTLVEYVENNSDQFLNIK